MGTSCQWLTHYSLILYSLESFWIIIISWYFLWFSQFYVNSEILLNALKSMKGLFPRANISLFHNQQLNHWIQFLDLFWNKIIINTGCGLGKHILMTYPNLAKFVHISIIYSAQIWSSSSQRTTSTIRASCRNSKDSWKKGKPMT